MTTRQGPDRSGARSPWAQSGLVKAAERLFLPTVFAMTAAARIFRDVIYPHHVGFDGRLYTDASRVWLAGGDPWLVSYEFGTYFAAPPPSLLITAPLTLMPSWIAGLIVVVGSAVLALAAIRALGLPIYWMLWTPILDGYLSGSLDVATLALLVLARGRFASLAPMFKVYSVLPLLGERLGRRLIVAAFLWFVTIPILPWGTFISDLPMIGGHLETQSMSTSVWSTPLLWVLFAIGLLAIGPRRAGWLSVPILWPWTQPHYAALALPVVATSTVLAVGFALSFLLPWAPAAAVAIYVIETFVMPSTAGRRRAFMG